VSVVALRNESESLDTLTVSALAVVANEEHELARQSGCSMLEHALKAGAALNAAKAQVGHGNWLSWLDEHFVGSRQMADNYRHLAANCQRVSNLEETSIRGALKALQGKSDSVHFSSDSDEWETPQDLYDRLNQEFQFTLDVCASDENHKCANYFTQEDDGLNQSWTGVCWMNPPYSTIAEWMQKAWESAQDGATVVCLIPARVGSGHWWDYGRYGQVRFLKGRLKFGDSNNSAPFDSAVVVFGPSIKPEVIWWER
jgi:phage N-6-adenine-methyltransferase